MTQVTVVPPPPVTVEVVQKVVHVTATARPVTVIVSKVGVPGPPGPGASSQLPVIPFAYGDASGNVLVLPSGPDLEITIVQFEIEVPFDGAGASLMLGTPGTPDLLVASADIDPAEVATVEVAPRVRLPGGTSIRLSINPGSGATQGAGTIVIHASPFN